MRRLPKKDPKVDAIISELPPGLRRIAGELRRAIHSVAPTLEECVKWNVPNWKGRQLVVCLMVYSDHLNLGLWRGAELAPSFPMVEGTGKSLRHIKVKSATQARSNEIRRVIRAAVSLDAAE